MTNDQVPERARRGLFEAKRDNTLIGLKDLEVFVGDSKNPEILAWYGYCLATEKKSFSEGIDYCLKALRLAPRNSNSYLCMGKIYLQAGRKNSALKAFNKGLELEPNPLLVKELSRHSTRKRPVFPFFHRDNPLNIYSGRLLSKLSLR